MIVDRPSQQTWVGKTAGRGGEEVETVETDVPAHTHRTFHQEVWERIPKCAARTRSGRACRGLIVRGKRRCRMHGGAKGSGAQIGNRNRLTHGKYSRDQRELRALIQLDTALQNLLSAEMEIVGVVARGETKRFDRVVRTANVREEAVRRAAARMEAFLISVERIVEADDLVTEIACVLTPQAVTPGNAASNRSEA